MKILHSVTFFILLVIVCAQQSAERTLIFGKNYAVLNLDLMTTLIDSVKDITEEETSIADCSRWIGAVHKKSPRQFTTFRSLFFSPGELELANGAPFTKLLEGLGSFLSSSLGMQISSNFTVDRTDTVLQKTRWYGGAVNSLEQTKSAEY